VQLDPGGLPKGPRGSPWAIPCSVSALFNMPAVTVARPCRARRAGQAETLSCFLNFDSNPTNHRDPPMSDTPDTQKPFTLADLKILTPSAPVSNTALHIPTVPTSAERPPHPPATLAALHIPTDGGAAHYPETAEAEASPMSPAEIAEGLRALAQRGVSLSGKKGRPIRAQYFLNPRQAAMAQLTKLGTAFIVGRPVTQALVLRLALVLLFRTVTDALKDPALAAALRADLEIARGAE
jgi:hypothetical protein